MSALALGPYTDDSKVSVSNPVAPGAGVIIQNHALPAGGTYDLRALLFLSGTAEVLPANLRLRKSDLTNNINVTVMSTVSGLIVPLHIPRLLMPVGYGFLQWEVIAAAAAGAQYNIVTVTTRVG